ncbi:MAG: FAD-dependent oxidoreductase [Pseudomonadota bacterium]
MRPISVIGAGVAGLCVATELVARGAEVTLIDKVATPGSHACSWWAGGMLAPQCEAESAEEPVERLGALAANWWAAQGVPIHRHGTLVVALDRDGRELNRFARRTTGAAAVDADRIAALEPDLAGRITKGLFFEDEGHLDPRGALATLSVNLAGKGVAVTDTEPRGLTIDCRGLAARDALSDLRGVKGEMLIIRCPDVDLTRTVRLLHPRIPLYIVPRGEGVYMIGATVIEATERSRITARSILEMLSAAYALHPAFGEAEILEIGTDARPAFPDNLPRIRRRGTTVYANGLFRHGFLLGPALASQVADMVLDGKSVEFCDEDHPERGAA